MIRVGGLAFGSSEYTFTMVVAVFVLCIARGSFAVSARADIGRYALPGRSGCSRSPFAGLYFLLETAPYWAHVLRVVFRDYDAAFYPYYGRVFLRLSFIAGRAFFTGGRGSLPFTCYGAPAENRRSANSLLRRYRSQYSGSAADAIRGETASRACRAQLPNRGALAAAWSNAHPKSDGFAPLA